MCGRLRHHSCLPHNLPWKCVMKCCVVKINQRWCTNLDCCCWVVVKWILVTGIFPQWLERTKKQIRMWWMFFSYFHHQLCCAAPNVLAKRNRRWQIIDNNINRSSRYYRRTDLDGSKAYITPSVWNEREAKLVSVIVLLGIIVVNVMR